MPPRLLFPSWSEKRQRSAPPAIPGRPSNICPDAAARSEEKKNEAKRKKIRINNSFIASYKTLRRIIGIMLNRLRLNCSTF